MGEKIRACLMGFIIKGQGLTLTRDENFHMTFAEIENSRKIATSKFFTFTQTAQAVSMISLLGGIM